MSSWLGAGMTPQSAGVGEDSLPAIRAYLHQVIFYCLDSSISVCVQSMQLKAKTCQPYDLHAASVITATM